MSDLEKWRAFLAGYGISLERASYHDRDRVEGWIFTAFSGTESALDLCYASAVLKVDRETGAFRSLMVTE